MTDKMATRDAYGKILTELGGIHANLVVLDADLSGSTKTKEFAKVYPDRFFNMGIAEQNLYGTAAGMAFSGKIVCASTFAIFAAGRAFEIIRNSIGYPRANVKICATHAGITVGEDGASHQTFEDIALMRTIPGMTVINPCDGISAMKLIAQAVETEGPCYIRLGRAAVPVIYGQDSEVQIGKAQVLKTGADVTLVATGLMVQEALDAAALLEQEGISARVVDMHTIKPLDGNTLLAAAHETGAVVTAEEHSVIGGLGGAVAEFLGANAPVPMAFVGQRETFGESGKPNELLEKYGMTASAIAAEARKILERKAK